jgi:hypothetical protein
MQNDTRIEIDFQMMAAAKETGTDPQQDSFEML